MKRKGRADGRVEVKITVAPGVRKSFYGKSRAAAQRAADSYVIREYKANALGVEEITPIRVSDWADIWLDSCVRGTVKENTLEAGYIYPLQHHILPVLGRKLTTDVKTLQIQSLLNVISDNYKFSTVRKVRTVLKSMFDAAVSNNYARSNPVTGTKITAKKRRAAKRFYDRETVDKILAFDHPFSYLVRILLECGLRREELCALKWKDIAPSGISIERTAACVHGQPILDEDTKTEASHRKVPISKDLFADIVKARGNAKDEDYICAAGNGKMLNPQHFARNRLKPFYADFSAFYGLKDFPALSPHEHRHTCGTLMYRETRDVYKVMTFLGHSSVEVTASVYVHPDSTPGISYKDYQ